MAFHRYSVPTYFGGLPVGYDYINDPATNGDAGISAFADGKKSSGVNAGTYFIAFNEDATSNDANRPAKALAQNTDAIDDILHRDLALAARTADVTAGSAVSSIVIAGQVFVGDLGVSNTQAQRDALISVLDNNDNEVLVGNTKVQASLIHDGSSNNVVGTQTSGFFNTVTVNLNVAIPIGTTYRLYYGSRGNLATLPKDAFTSIKIRGAQEVEAAVEQLFRDLHSSAAGTNWNDPWAASVNSLARTGLDGRYRLSTTDPGGTPALNTPGNGGTITRDGPSLAVEFPSYDLTTFGTVGVTRYPDPLLAAWRLRRATKTVSTAYDTRQGGDYGIVQESPYHNLADVGEVAYNHVTNAIVTELVPRSITTTTLAAHNVTSKINATGIGVVNPSAGTDATSRRTLQVASGDYIRNTSNQRVAVRPTDLIEVTDATSGQVVGTYRLDAVLTDTSFTVKAVSGALPPIGPSGASANVKLRWLQTIASLGGQHRAGSGSTHGVPSLFVAQPSALTDGYSDENIAAAAILMSAHAVRGIGAPELQYNALLWGGFGLDGVPQYNGRLDGDGGMRTFGGRQSLNLISRNPINQVIGNGGGTVTFDLQSEGSSRRVSTNGSISSATPLTIALSTATGFSPVEGDEWTLDIGIANGVVGPFSVVWPGNFVFSGSDGVVPTSNSSGNAYTIHYEFLYRNSVWQAVRTDYM